MERVEPQMARDNRLVLVGIFSLSPVWRLKLEVDGDRVANPHWLGLKETKFNVTGTEPVPHGLSDSYHKPASFTRDLCVRRLRTGMSRRLAKDRTAIAEGRELVKRLREFQRRTGLSRKQLAELIGVSYSSAYYWMKGPTLPEMESRDKLRRFLEREEFG